MDINKILCKAINDSLEYNGLGIELSSHLGKGFFNLNEEIGQGNVRVYINGLGMDSHMFLYVFAEMLKNNEVEIIISDKAPKGDYLEKLGKGLE